MCGFFSICIDTGALPRQSRSPKAPGSAGAAVRSAVCQHIKRQECMRPSKLFFPKDHMVFYLIRFHCGRYMVSSLTRDIHTNPNKIFHIPSNNAWHPQVCCLPVMMQDAQKSLQQSPRGLFSHFHNYTVSNNITNKSYLKTCSQIFNDDISYVMCGIKVICMIRPKQ